jgi:RINT-1/TIP-1 family
MSRETVSPLCIALILVAESRYNEILSSKDASEIEYEAIDLTDVKPTKGAMRIMDLLETFTGSTPAPATTLT